MSDSKRSRSERRLPSALRLRQPLEHLYASFDYGARIERDAIKFPLRYGDPQDQEVVALLEAAARPAPARARSRAAAAARRAAS